MRKKARLHAAAVVGVLAVLLAATPAGADLVLNDVVFGGPDTFVAGGSVDVWYWITPLPYDGGPGWQSGYCNPADGTAATVNINTPAGVTATPGALVFNNCTVFNAQKVTLSSAVGGDYPITVTVNDAGSGGYNTALAAFTLHVLTPPVVSVGNAAASEGAGAIGFSLTLDKPWPWPVSVDYATEDNSAVSPDDFTAASGTAFFPPGNTTQPLAVAVFDDNIDEVNENFRVQLSNPVGCTIAGRGRANGTIRDNDATPRMSIIGATWWEHVGVLTFPVLLDRPSSRTVTVDYNTLDWAAAAPGDYTATSGTLSFPPLTTVAYISVTVIDDVVREPVENFKVKLSSPKFATLVPLGTGVGTIIDNDLAL